VQYLTTFAEILKTLVEDRDQLETEDCLHAGDGP
jgi:hypothetical protein